MKKEERIQSLSSLQSTNLKKRILYNGERKDFDVYDIPLEFLTYNAHNGRIMSLTKSFEKQYGTLNPSDEKHKEIIENFLWESSPDYNSHTLESLKRYGQNEIGIVTKDGVIIDGNRRASLINILNKEDSRNRLFQAIILPDELQNNQKEISKLETIYQIGVDDKVDYNPIEKYLKCAELLVFYNENEVATMMAESVPKIRTYLSILELMEGYLSYLGYSGIYTKLYKKEGHFVDLNNYLNSYYKRTVNHYVDWSYNDDDIEKMKFVYFDFIRLGYPVSSCRVIARPNKGNSFFCYYDIWDEFYNDVQQIKSSYSELSLDDFKKENGGVSLETITNNKDKVWSDKLSGPLLFSLEYSSRILDDKKDANAPAELLKRVKGTLGQIKPVNIVFDNVNEIESLIKDIRKQLDSIEKYCVTIK